MSKRRDTLYLHGSFPRRQRLSGEEAVGGSDAAPFGRISPRLALAALVVVVISAFVGTGLSRYSRSVPSLAPATTLSASFTAPAPSAALPWPKVGQAALAADGYDGLLTHGADAGPQPIASTTKIMTALLVLKHHPLQGNDPGPDITITAADVTRYEEAIAQDESTVEVREGETLAERDLLEGMLIASANNFAEILASWDAGSIDSFVESMNAEAAALGMTHTHFADASGFSPQTTSTAEDLLIAARAAMASPVFAEIVAMQSATLPVAGDVPSTNELLGQDGIVGIKTGETDQAGDCLVFAADVPVNGRTLRIYGVVLGQPDRATLFAAVRQLVEAAPAQLSNVHIVSKGDPAGVYSAPWAGTAEAVAAGDFDVPAWAGATIATNVTLDTLKAPVAAGAKIGSLSATVGGKQMSVDLVAAAAIPAPSAWWRIRH